jgi:hypothetical protein
VWHLGGPVVLEVEFCEGGEEEMRAREGEERRAKRDEGSLKFVNPQTEGRGKR